MRISVSIEGFGEITLAQSHSGIFREAFPKRVIFVIDEIYQLMNVESIREYCLSKKEVTESFPFNDTALVFKVCGKMFALLNLHGDLSINLKCEPEKAIELREEFPSVLPGYHMNKRLWNTVLVEGSIPDKLLREWIDHSYEEVVKKLPKAKQALLY